MFALLTCGLLAVCAPDDGDDGGAAPRVWNVTITAVIDGSGTFTFTEDSIVYEHKHWQEPTDVAFNGRAWEKLKTTPEEWVAQRGKLDLAQAWVVKRSGRDIIGLEKTPKGFAVLVADSPNGADAYSITIAIPLRNEE